jgi:hypothetical protein
MPITLTTMANTDAREAISTKLTLFYYKKIQNIKCRLHVFTPKPIIATAYGHLADDLFISVFDNSSSEFWNKFSLIKIAEFIKDRGMHDSVYLQHGILLPELDRFIQHESDITVLNAISQNTMLKTANAILAKYCNLPLLADEDLISYDFRALSLSDKASDFMFKTTKEIMAKYPNQYISAELAEAILSYMAAYAKRFGLQVSALKTKCLDIHNNQYLEQFYAA